MTHPKFSIVVPTRNRCETLRETLETCLRQSFGDFEVVVSDNWSQDATEATVNAFADRRMRYVRTEAPVAMTLNFENGLSHARGDYLIFIGDDDALYPWALGLLDACFTRYDIDVVNWQPTDFVWPYKKRFRFTLYPQEWFRAHWIEQADTARDRLNTPKILNHFYLTGFDSYHGCVARPVTEAVRERYGFFFNGIHPDVASSYDAVDFAQRCMHLGVPLSVAGTSRKSNGAASFNSSLDKEQVAIAQEFSTTSRAAFPQSLSMITAPCKVAPYLGHFVEYWLRRFGTLQSFDHVAWRQAYLHTVASLHPGKEATLIDNYNTLVEFLRRNGAEAAASLAVADVEALKQQMQPYPAEERRPFVFGDAVLRIVDTALGHGILPRGVRFEQKQGELKAIADAKDSLFGVQDFVLCIERGLGLAPKDMVDLALDDLEMARSIFLMRLAHGVGAGRRRAQSIWRRSSSPLASRA